MIKSVNVLLLSIFFKFKENILIKIHKYEARFNSNRFENEQNNNLTFVSEDDLESEEDLIISAFYFLK